ncbi:MAG TPA: PD-(D/E)XK nuclease family protein, partial [Thermoanaerobaculia bacterium]|nr:PD-(D/E)XK nuclease family protein [Thermoanaerobaculia bacterium]
MAQQLDLFGPGSLDPVPVLPSAPAVISRGRLLAARGALATEAVLFSEVEALFSAAQRNPALLARPVRIVVPSKSLRLHVASALARHRGRGTAGLIVQTLHALALEVLEHAGEPAGSGGGALFEVLARRAARAQPALFRGLDDLIEGYGAAAATIRDLLDAGLDPVHAEALDELLAAEGKAVATAMDLERACALVRAAAASQSELERLGGGRIADLLRRATQVLLSRPEALPARAVIVHGFADATGLATDLIEALVRASDATVLIDRPPDPSFQKAGESGTGEVRLERAFTDRWAGRIALATGPALSKGPEPAPPRREAFTATGTDAEVREAALRLRALLDGGVAPERMGVVARNLGPYRFAVRRHFERLGVPYSGLAATGGKTPMGRRLAALEDLLRRGGDTPVSRWLDAAIGLPGGAGRPGFELRLAFAALGAGRLRDAAEIELAGLLDPWGKYALPIRQGFTAGTDRDPEPEGVEEGEGLEPIPPEAAAPGESGAEKEGNAGNVRAPRRRIPGKRLAAAIAAAKRASEKLENWPEAAPAAVHLQRLRSLLAGDLGWSPKAGEGGNAVPDTEIGRAYAALEALAGEVPSDFPLTAEEFGAMVGEAFSRLGTGGFGGNGGGGVQVLSVTEARGRTFDHLFVLGLARDAFPRPVREDPLLPDSLRRVLRRLLPDLAEKRAGFDEERHLFAQLLSAAPQVTLSWQSADDDGRPRAASPLVERIVFEAGGVVHAPGLFAAPVPAVPAGPRSSALLRPAWEHSTLAALHGSRIHFSEVLPAALAELALTPEIGAFRPEATAQARLAALAELDPDLRTPEGRAANHRLGPWFGFVGALGADPRSKELDPRRRDLAVTHLERLDGCPWQFFLSRLLAIEPTPDPLQALPGLDARLLGNLIHAVLDTLAKRVTSGPSADWPTDEEIEPILRDEAAKMVALEGIALSGLGRALAERARPYLAAAREPWRNELITTEVKGGVEVVDPVTGGLRTLTFRADREDRLPDGAPLYTDWKTGRPLSLKKRPETRRADLIAKIGSGALLQAVAYRRSAGPGAIGRYYYLKPEAEVREFAVEQDPQTDAAFDRAVSAGLAAHAAGSFFPRLVDPAGQKEPRRCEYCEVAEACLRGDSGARRRLFEWSARGEAEGATD